MRITKLHLLFLMLLTGTGFLGYHFWETKQAEEKKALEQRLQSEMEAQRKAHEEALKSMAQQQAASTATVQQVQAPDPKEPQPVSYTVEKGDTLWSIAKKKLHFGAGHRWYDIWKANDGKVSDFDRIKAGQVLTIPLDKPENHPWPKTSESRKRKILGEEPRQQPPSN